MELNPGTWGCAWCPATSAGTAHGDAPFKEKHPTIHDGHNSTETNQFDWFHLVPIVRFITLPYCFLLHIICCVVSITIGRKRASFIRLQGTALVSPQQGRGGGQRQQPRD